MSSCLVQVWAPRQPMSVKRSTLWLALTLVYVYQPGSGLGYQLFVNVSKTFTAENKKQVYHIRRIDLYF